MNFVDGRVVSSAWRSEIATHHVTKHITPIHNILSTAPQLSISQKALGTLPDDDNNAETCRSYHTLINWRNNLCICWLFTLIFTARRLDESFGFKGLVFVKFNKRNLHILEKRASIYKVKLKHAKENFALEKTMKIQTLSKGLDLLFLWPRLYTDVGGQH
jgi:hypothetical protein